MNFINTISAQRFSLDGIDYFKNFLSKVNGNNITIYNAYDSRNVLVEAAIFSQINLNGTVHYSVSALQSALLPIIYTRNSLNGLVTQSPLFNYFSNITGFTLVGQNLTVNAGWSWFIEGTSYNNPASVVLNIPFAVSGKKRIDIVVANTNNTFELIQGIEVLVANTPAEPIVPIGMIKTTTLIVNDSTGGISSPVIPVPGSGTGSGIVDAPAIAGTGTTVMTFDEIRYHGLTNQIGNIALTLNATPNINKNGRIQVLDINGNSVNTFTPPANSINSNGVAFDNTKNNVIYFDFVNGKVKFNVTHQNLPDVTAPTLTSATVQNANPSNIVLTYNEPLTVSPLPATTDFALNLGKTVTGVSISGSIVTLTVNAPYINADSPTISYTSGTNKIKDLVGNNAVNFVGQVITNNINPPAFNSKSISQTTNNILTSVANPTGVSFSTGIGGTDLPFTLSYWVYQTISGNGFIIGLANISTPEDYQYVVFHSASAIAMYLRSTPDDFIGTYSTSGIPLNIWTNVVITYNGNKTNTGIKIYKDGALQSTLNDNKNSYTGGVAVSSNYKLNIAGTQLAPASLYNKGLLDEIAVINKELSQAEVTELYNGGTPTNLLTSSFASNVKSYYRFEDNLNDLGTNGYNLTPAGTTVYSTNKP